MTDIVERHGSVYFLDDLDDCPEPWRSELEHRYDEIERLRRVNDLLRAETSNPRYWEARYRDEAAKVDELQAALRSVIEAWDNEYAGEMAVDRAIGEARELLPQTGETSTVAATNDHNAPSQQNANPSQCPTSKTE